MTARFYPYEEPFELQRLYCPDYKRTFRFRPEGYLPGHYYPVGDIYKELFEETKPSDSNFIPLDTIDSWHRRLSKQAKICLKNLISGDFPRRFVELIQMMISPVSRVIHLAIPEHFTAPTPGHLFSG